MPRGFGAIARVLGRLAEPLFRGAVVDFTAEPDAPTLIVIRPKGSFDLWAPWVELMAIGVPLFGLYVPGRLSFFANRPS